MRMWFFSGFIIFIFMNAYAQVNPFLNSVKNDSAKAIKSTDTKKPSRSISEKIWVRMPFSKTIISIQRDLTNTLAARLRSVKEHVDAGVIVTLLFLAFIYGMIHSLGPGHAKLLFVSHTMVHSTPVNRIIFAGLLFSIVHAGTSLILFLLLKVFLGFGQTTIGMYTHRLINISGILIVFAGILTLFATKIEEFTERSVKRFFKGVSNICAVAVIAGIAPCPGAFLLLSFSNITGVFYMGILAVIAVSIGMALTVSFAGTAGGFVASRVNQHDLVRFGKKLGVVFRCIGAGIIILIGVSLIFK